MAWPWTMQAQMYSISQITVLIAATRFELRPNFETSAWTDPQKAFKGFTFVNLIYIYSVLMSVRSNFPSVYSVVIHHEVYKALLSDMLKLDYMLRNVKASNDWLR